MHYHSRRLEKTFSRGRMAKNLINPRDIGEEMTTKIIMPPAPIQALLSTDGVATRPIWSGSVFLTIRMVSGRCVKRSEWS